MNKHFCFLKITLVILAFLFNLQGNFAQSVQWQKCLGGSLNDKGLAIQPTLGGDYILSGFTKSQDGDVSTNNSVGGNSDTWVVKLTSNGILKWEKAYGGSASEIGYSIQVTADGGYIVAGQTASTDGDVTGFHGTSATYYPDAWVQKLDSLGTLEWQKCLGGTWYDYGRVIQVASDGGYIMVGYTQSADGDVSGGHGNNDVWVVKLDVNGLIQWQKCLGGSGDDAGYDIQVTSDGGYILCGYTKSNNGDVTGNHGYNDAWIVKLDSIGTLQWQKTLGGTKLDFGNSIKPTSDGGYILIGRTTSNDGDISGNNGNVDVWVVKLDSIGIIQWQNSLGGTGSEEGCCIQNTPDGGYILTGHTNSNDIDVSGNHGNTDAWVVKMNSTGMVQWQKCLGGTGYFNLGLSIQVLQDGTYILIGYTESNDGDANGNHGEGDMWVVKLDSSSIANLDDISIIDFKLFPNPIINNRLILNYTLAQSTPIQIMLTDILGNTLLIQTEQTQLPGLYQKQLNLDNLSSGSYFLQFKTEYGSRTTQIVKN